MTDANKPVPTFPNRQNGALPMRDSNFHRIDAPEFADDLLLGCSALTLWLLGTTNRRRGYHIVQTARLPTFKLGSKIAAQKSVLRAYFWAQQKRRFGSDEIEALVRLQLILTKALAVCTRDGAILAAPSQAQAAIRVAVLEASQEIEHFLGGQNEERRS
jgi:hypothetical protein